MLLAVFQLSAAHAKFSRRFILMPLPPLDRCRRHAVFGLSVRALTWQISYKPTVGSSPNFQLRCSWGKRDLIRLWCHKVKVSQCETTWSNNHFGRHFPHLSPECIQRHILMKLITITDHHVHMTLMTSSRSWVQRSKSQTTFSENTLFRRMVRRRRPSSWSPAKRRAL